MKKNKRKSLGLIGYSLEESVRRAKDYISLVLSSRLDLGHGSGPLRHSYLQINN